MATDKTNDLALDEAIDTVEGTQAATTPTLFGESEEVVARYTHCALCGSNLHFTHFTDFARNLTQETARCPECGVRVRQVMHKLQ
jgi:hypothetical protein